MKKYAWAFLLAAGTAVLCLGVADGVFGLEGRITGWTDLGGYNYEYTLDIHDHTGKILFWAALIGLPVVFSRWVGVKESFVTVPVLVAAWYGFSAYFGRHANHGILDHPSGGFIEIGAELAPFINAAAMWAIQAAVLAVFRRLRKKT